MLCLKYFAAFSVCWFLFHGNYLANKHATADSSPKAILYCEQHDVNKCLPPVHSGAKPQLNQAFRAAHDQ